MTAVHFPPHYSGNKKFLHASVWIINFHILLILMNWYQFYEISSFIIPYGRVFGVLPINHQPAYMERL